MKHSIIILLVALFYLPMSFSMEEGKKEIPEKTISNNDLMHMEDHDINNNAPTNEFPAHNYHAAIKQALNNKDPITLQLLSLQSEPVNKTTRKRGTLRQIPDNDLELLTIAENNKTAAAGLLTWKDNTARRNQFAAGAFSILYAISKGVYDLLQFQDPETNDVANGFNLVGDGLALLGGIYLVKQSFENIPAKGNYNQAVMMQGLINHALNQKKPEQAP